MRYKNNKTVHDVVSGYSIVQIFREINAILKSFSCIFRFGMTT